MPRANAAILNQKCLQTQRLLTFDIRFPDTAACWFRYIDGVNTADIWSVSNINSKQGVTYYDTAKKTTAID